MTTSVGELPQEVRIRQQLESLRALGMRPVRSRADLETVIREIAASAASLLGVQRVSVWAFDGDNSLRCIAFQGPAAYPSALGQSLPADRAPRFFKAVRSERLFVSSDALHDGRLAGLEAHLAATGIRAMLSAPIITGSHRWGAICANQLDRARVWGADEENFLTSLADICAIAVSSFDRIEAEGRLSGLESQLRTLSGNPAGLYSAPISGSDELTGLPNRTTLYEGMRQAADRYRELAGPPYAIAVIDCDDLGKVNESLGKEGGDATLRALAVRLAETVAGRGLLARLRSDEFGLLLDRLDHPAAVDTVLNDLDLALRVPLQVFGRQVSMTLSMGVSLPQTADETTEDVLRNAATAMRRAKEQGGGRWLQFQPKMRADAVRRLEVETDLLAALASDQLRLSYQPIISPVNRRLTGFEALIRWHHPERGMIPPDQFIPQAEQSHLIFAIGDKTLEQACRQAAEWRRLLPDFPVTISVNLSARQLLDQNLIEIIDRHLKRFAVPPGAIKLELTETSIIANPAFAANQIAALRSRGIPVVIDDFGTGYSSFNHLADYEVDGLKIDKKFVHDLARSRLSKAIVKALMSLAKTLELEVVAEGVETDEVAAALREEGDASLQGWLFSPALPADQATDYLLEAARQRTSDAAD